MRILLDEMLPRALAVALSERGHDVDAVSERTDLRTQPDSLVFAAAQDEGRALVTGDMGIRRLANMALTDGGGHYGLILVRGDPRNIGQLVAALDALMTAEVDLTSREHWLA